MKWIWCALVSVLGFLTLTAGIARGAEIDPDNPPLDPAVQRMVDEARFALIIGNGRYEKWPALRNPRNDANRMAEVLGKYGFDVLVLIDGNRKQMEEYIARFRNKLRNGGVALVFYAGHGLQFAGQNYLIPVDSPPLTADNMDQGIQLGSVLNIMSGAPTRLNIAIIDACRTPPNSGGARVALAGLAQPEKARDTLFSFATAPDSVALDGMGDNSPFSESLATHVEAHPGLKIEELLKRVLVDVKRRTGDAQAPWLASNIGSEFYFDPKKAGKIDAPLASTAPAAPGLAYTRLPGWRDMGNRMFARSESSFTELDVISAIAQRKRIELLWTRVRELQKNAAHTAKAMWLLSSLNDVRNECDRLIERGQVAPCSLQVERIELEVTALGVAPSAVQVGMVEGVRGGDSGVAPPPVRPGTGQREASCDPSQGAQEALFPEYRGEVSEQDRQRAIKIYTRLHCLCEPSGNATAVSNRNCQADVMDIKDQTRRKRLDEAERRLARLIQRLRP